MELAISNVTVPVCETGEENYCMGVIMLEHLIELSNNCSPGCTITKYKGAVSDLCSEDILISSNFLKHLPKSKEYV